MGEVFLGSEFRIVEPEIYLPQQLGATGCYGGVVMLALAALFSIVEPHLLQLLVRGAELDHPVNDVEEVLPRHPVPPFRYRAMVVDRPAGLDDGRVQAA